MATKKQKWLVVSEECDVVDSVSGDTSSDDNCTVLQYDVSHPQDTSHNNVEGAPLLEDDHLDINVSTIEQTPLVESVSSPTLYNDVPACEATNSTTDEVCLDQVAMASNVGMTTIFPSEDCDSNPEEFLTVDTSELQERTVDDIAVLVAHSVSEGESVEPQTSPSVSHSSGGELSDKETSPRKDRKKKTTNERSSGPEDCRPSTSRPSLSFRLKRSSYSRQISDSDSSDSDYIRLETPLSLPSTASSQMTSSSVSSSFRFIQPVIPSPPLIIQQPVQVPIQNPPQQPQHDDDDDDSESLSSDIDDRCESDISGIAHDEDLSSVMYHDHLEPSWFFVGNVIRSYRHCPNASLNATLTTVALLALFTVVGVGIGHYMGSGNEDYLHQQQISQMRMLQDDYVSCLQKEQAKQNTIEKNEQYFEKSQTLSTLWKERYETLMLENLEISNKLKRTELEYDYIKMDHERLQEQADDMSQFAKAAEKAQKAVLLEKEQIELSLKQDVEHLHLEVAKQVQTIIVKEQLYDDLLKQFVSLQNQLSIREEDFSGFAQQIQDLTDMKDALEIEKIQLEEELTLRQSDIDKQFQLEYDIAQLKDELNALKLENSELQQTTLKLKYTLHPGNQEKMEFEADIPALMDEMNVLKIEYAELQKSNMNLKYALNTVNTERSNINVETGERIEDVADNNVVQSRSNHTCPPHTPPTLATCMQLFLPEFNYTTLMNTIEEYQCSDDMKAIRESILHQWRFLSQSAKVQQSQEICKEFGKVVLQKLHEANDVIGDQLLTVVEGAKDKMTYIKSEIHRAMHENAINNFVNKTRTEVSLISHEVYDTLLKVKNLTTDVLKDKTAKLFNGDVSRSLTDQFYRGKDKILDIKNHVHENLMQFSGKISRDWLPSKDKKSSRRRSKRESKAEMKHSHRQNNRNENKDIYTDEDDDIIPQIYRETAGKYEEKTDRRKKQSNHELYDDFWKKSGYNPDDYAQDGFFEGNNREWSKHEEEFRRLHRRITFLNADQFYSMDDDDIDDIYEELDDLEDHIEDEKHQDKQQIAWLTCQQRWWKSRCQRKNKSRYLLNGCNAAQLTKWQIHLLCTTPTDLTTKDYDVLDCIHNEGNLGGKIDNWYLRWAGHRGQHRHSAQWYVNRMNLHTEL